MIINMAFVELSLHSRATCKCVFVENRVSNVKLCVPNLLSVSDLLQ